MTASTYRTKLVCAYRGNELADATQTDFASKSHRLQVGSTVAQTFRTFGRAPHVFLLFGVMGIVPDIVQLLLSRAGTSAAGDLVAALADMLVHCLTQTAMTLYVVRQSEQSPTHLREALWLGVRRYLPMIGTSFFTFLAVGVGFLLLVVPGVLLALRFCVAVPVCAIERKGPISSMDRSAALTAGHRWAILGCYAILFVPMVSLVALMALLATTNEAHLFEWLFNAIQIFLGPLFAILAAVIYTSLRRLKENDGVAEIFD